MNHIIKKIKVSELLPNPNRNLKYYQIDHERVNALIESFRASGEWPGIIVRRNSDNRYERAFGEHRVAAHKKIFGKDSEIEVIVMDLDDAAMLRYMANENGEAWTHSFLAQMETVEATIERFAQGQIKLNTLRNDENYSRWLRRAPKLAILTGAELRRAPRSELYNGITIAEFLGWLMPKKSDSSEVRADRRVETSLAALEFIEQGVFERRHFEGLDTHAALILLKETRRAHRNAEALANLGLEPSVLKKAQERFRVEIPRKVSDALRAGEGTRTLHEITNALMDEIAPRRDQLPMLDLVVDRLAAEIRGFIDSENQTKRAQKIQEILAVQSDMSRESQEKLQQLRSSLDYLGRRCLELAEAIRAPRKQRHTQEALSER